MTHTPSPDFPEPPTPRLDFFADATIDVEAPQVLADGPAGLRRVVPIRGGTVQGEGWRARVLPGGSDFQQIPSDTLSYLDARYGLETDAGDLVFVQNHAVRAAPAEVMARLLRGEPADASQVYFRCTPRFETNSKALGWINERLFIGTGVRLPGQVVLRFFCVN